MQHKGRKMNRGWALTAASFALVFLLHCVRTVWINTDHFIILGTVAEWINTISRYSSVVVFAFLVLCFVRQKVDGMLSAVFWIYAIDMIAYDVLINHFALGRGIWSAQTLLSTVIPIVLLALCCSEKKEQRPENGAKIVVTIVLIASILEIFMMILKLHNVGWKNSFAMFVENAVVRLSIGMFFFAAYRAIASSVEEKLPVEQKE